MNYLLSFLTKNLIRSRWRRRWIVSNANKNETHILVLPHFLFLGNIKFYFMGNIKDVIFFTIVINVTCDLKQNTYLNWSLTSFLLCTDKGVLVEESQSMTHKEADGSSEFIGFPKVDGTQNDTTKRRQPRDTRRSSLWSQQEVSNEARDRRGEKADESSVACLGLHEYLCKEIPCIVRLILIKGISTRKGSRKMCVLKRIFPTRKDLLRQETNVSSTLV